MTMAELSLKHDPINIVVCGMGGQGNIVASGILGAALVEMGLKVTVGETYGASQRGGSVMSHIRASAREELGVLIPKGRAQIIVGFEPLETLRIALQYGNQDTVVIYDDRVNYPLGVLIGEEEYPSQQQINDQLKHICSRVYVVPGTQLALELGNAKAANITMMGALSAHPETPILPEEYLAQLAENFKGKVLDLNMEAFNQGAQALLAQL